MKANKQGWTNGFDGAAFLKTTVKSLYETRKQEIVEYIHNDYFSSWDPADVAVNTGINSMVVEAILEDLYDKDEIGYSSEGGGHYYRNW